MTILLQALLGFSIITFLLMLAQLALALLIRSGLVPALVWYGLGQLYGPWRGAHPFLFYGVLVLLVLPALANCAKPIMKWAEDRQRGRLAEKVILDDLARARAEGRTNFSTRYQIVDGFLIPEQSDEPY